mmetsp:Transcript_32694/g.90254  ORF Transcript_32694/g.90254 Transcript_32694/m.90254 type:complete len:271 (-) Transcript_32694:507-1319(-)
MVSQEQQPWPTISGLKSPASKSLSEAGRPGEAILLGWTSRRQRSSPPSLAVTLRNMSVIASEKTWPPKWTCNGSSTFERTVQSQMKSPPAAVSTPQRFRRVSSGRSARRKASKCCGGTRRTWLVPVSTRKRAAFGGCPPTATPPDVTQKLRWVPAPPVPAGSSSSADAHDSVPGRIASGGRPPNDRTGPSPPGPPGTRVKTAGWPCSWRCWYSGRPATARWPQARPQMPSQERCEGRAASSTIIKDWLATCQEPKLRVSRAATPRISPVP